MDEPSMAVPPRKDSLLSILHDCRAHKPTIDFVSSVCVRMDDEERHGAQFAPCSHMEEPSTAVPQDPSLQQQVNFRRPSVETPLKHEIRTTCPLEPHAFRGTCEPRLIMATLDKEVAEAKQQHQSLVERCNQILDLMLAFEQYRLCAERENLRLRALNIELSKLFHRQKEIYVNSVRQLSVPALDHGTVASPNRHMDGYTVNETDVGQTDHEIITEVDSIRPLTMPSSPVQSANYITSQISDLSIHPSKPLGTSFEEIAGHAHGRRSHRPGLIYINSPVIHRNLFAGSESSDASHSSREKMFKSSSDNSEHFDSPLKPSNISIDLSPALSADYSQASKSSQDFITPLQSSPSSDLSSTGSSYSLHSPSPIATSKDSNSNHSYGSSSSSSCPTGPLPKSISIRVKGMALKPKTKSSTSSSDSATGRNTRSLLLSPLRPHRLQLESPRSEIENSSGDATMAGDAEYEAYEQGTYKTELCNKGLECPYGSRCQFAHGLEELRPVMRHRLYKTHPCRMFMAGRPCPYGHRCHFRHSPGPVDHMSGNWSTCDAFERP